MRIALSGAHRVGKTSLLERLSEELPDYELYAEPYFELEEAGAIFSEIPTTEDYLTQLLYSTKQIEKSNENSLFDRCPLDFFAYILATDPSYSLQTTFARIQDSMQWIDLLVFVPIEEPDRIECPDSDLPELRNEVNEIISEFINDFDVEIIEVRGSVTERVKQILNYIKCK